MKRVHKLFISIAALTSLGLGGAYAQPAGPTGPFGGPEFCPHGPGMGMMGGRGGQAAQAKGKSKMDFAANAAARLEQLKTELKLTPAQEKAWQAFADQSKQQMGQMQTMRDQFQPPAANAPQPPMPERMDKAIEFMKQRLTHMEAMNASMKELYATLTPEQKTVVEKHFAQRPAQGQGQGRGRMMRRAPAATPAAPQ